MGNPESEVLSLHGGSRTPFAQSDKGNEGLMTPTALEAQAADPSAGTSKTSTASPRSGRPYLGSAGRDQRNELRSTVLVGGGRWRESESKRTESV